ncbi:hypothetical protein ADL01_15865 [Streptomyces sp. NRRL WC-3618]|uniref:hypothetical protein n=1 Tax=Streptomyces sp. NRRL WC-3618 TaxID=1519490 RepID=UPI0006B03A42|nr:hypothetical protein [Streptomyces sp. NRRL WC-3618]KOV77490.1 hypothetical protein ADL01_15865 [Streptomyces sp. NRRL WC-3618]
MAVMTEELVPVLEDARHAHAAVLDRFRADATVTPPGAHRQLLERRAEEIRSSVQRIKRQERALHPRGVMDTAASVTRSVSRGVARTAMLPLTFASVIGRAILPGGGPAGPRQLLRNTEDEYAAAARALAACRAGEVVAEQADDQLTADLLGSLRRQDEELLQELENSLTEHARAVATATNGSASREGQGGGLSDAAAQTIQATFDRARDVARHGVQRTLSAAEEARRKTPVPGAVAEEVLGAVRREEDLPIPGFSQLSTEQITRRLRTLSQLDLTVIQGYERTHANRKRVLKAIEELHEATPWTGYDALDADDIIASLGDAPTGVARQVREYERRHRQRQEVVSAAETRVSSA